MVLWCCRLWGLLTVDCWVLPIDCWVLTIGYWLSNAYSGHELRFGKNRRAKHYLLWCRGALACEDYWLSTVECILWTWTSFWEKDEGKIGGQNIVCYGAVVLSLVRTVESWLLTVDYWVLSGKCWLLTIDCWVLSFDRRVLGLEGWNLTYWVE
jgi:hypothetical protein